MKSAEVQEVLDSERLSPEDKIGFLIAGFSDAVNHLLDVQGELSTRDFERRQRSLGVFLLRPAPGGNGEIVATCRESGFNKEGPGNRGVLGGMVMLQVIDISGIDPVYYDIDVVAHGKGDIGDKPKVTLPVGARDGELKGLEDVETRHGELSSILDAVRRATRRVYLPEQGFVPAWPGPDEF